MFIFFTGFSDFVYFLFFFPVLLIWFLKGLTFLEDSIFSRYFEFSQHPPEGGGRDFFMGFRGHFFPSPPTILATQDGIALPGVFFTKPATGRFFFFAIFHCKNF